MRKNKLFASLALALWVGVVAVPVVTFQGCALSGIFQSDPVGASLKTMKDTYESAVRTSGRLYVAKQITEPQMRRFRDEANKFYLAYTQLATIHEIQHVKEGDVRLEQVKKLLDVLVNALSAFSTQAPAPL